MKWINRRDGSMTSTYREAIDVCCCPTCLSGACPMETHHITPIAQGGRQNDYRNYICLCRDCHHEEGLHTLTGDVYREVMIWKIFAELLVVGVSSFDCDKNTFMQALRNLKADNKITPLKLRYRIKQMSKRYFADNLPLTLEQMVDRDNGRTDARIDAMHARVEDQMRREKRAEKQRIIAEKQRIKKIPIYLMWTKG